MTRKNRIPNKPRYSYVTRRAYKLLAELEIGSFPVDPFQIIRNFNNWRLLGWKELRDNCGDPDPMYLHRDRKDAETSIIRGDNRYMIVYDETIDYLPRIRFTLAHEIGHIVLGHFIEFEGTRMDVDLLTKAEHKVLETEADAFAAELLAPKTIIRRYPNIRFEQDDIARICFLSDKAAAIRAKELRRMDFSYFETEDTLLKNFYPYLVKCGVFPAPTFRLSEEQIIIPGELDDYIECEYWPFVAMTANKYEKKPELQAAAEKAVALYDDENMVLFVADEKDRQITEQGKDTLLKCLEKYASSSVRRIDIRLAQTKA